MVVYWLGATMGSIISVFLFKTKIVQNLLNKLKQETTEKEEKTEKIE